MSIAVDLIFLCFVGGTTDGNCAAGFGVCCTFTYVKILNFFQGHLKIWTIDVDGFFQGGGSSLTP